MKDIAAIRTGGKVHEPRKRLKYLEGLLKLLCFGLGGARYRQAKKRVRKAARLLADARRAEAHGEAAARLKGDAECHAPALAELEIIAARAHTDVAAPTAIANATAAATAEIEALRRDVRRWSLPKRDVRLYLKALRRTYAEARRKILEGIAAKDVALLHEARKSIIHHLHQLEILEPLWPELMRAWTAELTRLRTALGDLNDLAELREMIDDETTEFSSPELRQEAAEAISLSREQLLKRVKKRVRRVFAEKPSGLAQRLGTLWTRTAEKT